MRHVPSNDDDREEVERQRIQPWMLECLAMNPDYVHWGPYEDYMWKDGQGWDSRVELESFDTMWELDDLNEVVNFYFYAQRDSRECDACAGSGLNPETKRISDGFYAHSSPTGVGWNDQITQDEVQALVDAQRLVNFTHTFEVGKGWQWKEPRVVPTAEEVNAANHRPSILHGHDAINRWILVETRAKRLGVYGKCAVCDGHGAVFTVDAARLGLILWVLHPRKGCSRGVDIKNIRRDDLEAVRRFLAEAARRNADRFSKALLQPATINR